MDSYNEFCIKAKENVGKRFLKFIDANPDKPWDWGRMGISSNKFTYEYNIELLNLYLKESMKKVFEEFEELLLMPYNMEMAKKLGVYSGLSSEW